MSKPTELWIDLEINGVVYDGFDNISLMAEEDQKSLTKFIVKSEFDELSAAFKKVFHAVGLQTAALNAVLDELSWFMQTGDLDRVEKAIGILRSQEFIDDHLRGSTRNVQRTPGSDCIQRSQWQPIETAPKDGTSIYIFADDYSVPVVGHWYQSSNDGWWVGSNTMPIQRPLKWASLPSLPINEDQHHGGPANVSP